MRIDWDESAIAETDYSPIPPGEYVCCLTGHEDFETKNGAGNGVTLKWEVQEGDHKGRILFDSLLLHHTSEQAQQIARGRLKTLKSKVGKQTAGDTAELLGCRATLRVDVEQYDGKFRNRVKGYLEAKKSSAPQAQAKPQADKSKPAWKK